MNRVLLLAGLGLVGCSEIFQRACTLADCFDGLIVRFETAPTGTVTVDALAEGETTARTGQCTASGCVPGVQFENWTPAHVVITVTTSQGSKQYDLRPQYSIFRPNGEGCEPVCTSAGVKLALP